MTLRTDQIPQPRPRHEPMDYEDPPGFYGLLAEFTEEEELIDAVKAARAAGYTRIDAFTPLPIEGLGELVRPQANPLRTRDRAVLRQAVARRDWRGVADWIGRLNLVALLTLGAGVTGGIVGYLLQLWAMAANYPYLNIGGRPNNSWPYYLPITYELVILFAAFTALFGMILLNGLPRPYHPVFNVPEFARATQDRFFLLIEADDPLFLQQETTIADEVRPSTRQFLEALAAGRVYDAEK